MLFRRLAERDGSHGDTAAGRWNSARFYGGVLDVIRRAGAFRGRVLEIGPGEGVFAGQCLDAGLDYLGLEINEKLAEHLRARGLDVRVAKVPPIPASDGEFDLVVMMALVEHMPTFDQALELLAECRRVLRPGGAVVIQVPDALRGGIDFPQWDYSHSFLPTAYRIRQLLFDAGFEADPAVHFTGSLRGPIRLPLDLVGFLVHSRFAYWLGTSLGAEEWLLRYHKTFEPSFVVVARRVDQDRAG
jgi:SAM-dependent methyltransferase